MVTPGHRSAMRLSRRRCSNVFLADLARVAPQHQPEQIREAARSDDVELAVRQQSHRNRSRVQAW